MRHLDRAPKALHILSVAAFAAMVVLAAACTGPESGASEVDAGDSAARVSAAAGEPGTDFDALFYCKNSDGAIALERYLIGAQRDEGLPLPSSADYQDALPPICIVSPMGGVPPYTGSASIEGRELRRVTTGTTELTFLVPPLKPGWHTVDFAVTDSQGKSGSGYSNIELRWDNPNRISVGFDQPVAQLAEFTPGEVVSFEVAYEAYEPTEQPQLGIETFLSQNYSVTWNFGDGTSETADIVDRTGAMKATHAYAAEGLYDVSVTIKGRIFGQQGEAKINVDVRPEGSTRIASGEVVQQWKLVQTVVNPAGAPLRAYDVDKVFADDSLNYFVERTVSLDGGSMALGKVKGKGASESFIGSFEFAVTTLPDVLTAGQPAGIVVDGRVTNVLGIDVTGETIRISGLPGSGDATATITYENPYGSAEAVFQAPPPGALGDTIVITLSIDGCEACVIQWVYRYG